MPIDAGHACPMPQTGLRSYIERQALEIPWQMPAQNYASTEPFGQSPQLSTKHHSLG
jgi:hypothetical protein